MENIQFKFVAINEEEQEVMNFSIEKTIDVYQTTDEVVNEFEEVLFNVTNELGYDMEFHDVKENIIYKGYKYLAEDTHYMTVEIGCQHVNFSNHGFSE